MKHVNKAKLFQVHMDDSHECRQPYNQNRQIIYEDDMLSQTKELTIYRRRKNKGFTAIELLFALGIIALATIAIVYAMRGNTDKSNAQQMLTDVTTIVNNVRNIYNGSSTGYTDLDTEKAIGLGVFPTDLRVNKTANTVGNQFVSGTVAITAADDSSFTVEYTKVPTAVCSQIVSQLANEPMSSITIGGTEVYSRGSSIDMGAVSSGCKADNVTIDFISN